MNENSEINLGYNYLWPTNVYIGNIEEKILNETFQDILINLNTNKKNEFQTFDILENGSKQLKEFKDKIVWPAFSNFLMDQNIDIKKFPQRRLKSWITGENKNYVIPVHNHNGASISGIFYLFVSEQDCGGELILIDSRVNAGRGYKEDFSTWFENKFYSPKTGQYILFPSHVYHQTLPFTGNTRLGVVVDLFL